MRFNLDLADLHLIDGGSHTRNSQTGNNRIETSTGQWTGRGPGIFYSASIIWGLVGP